MRKLFIFFLSLLLSQGADVLAQDESSGGQLEAGNLLIESTGSPFASSGLLEFGSFRARYAVTDNIVPRLGFEMNVSDRQVTPTNVVSLNEFLFLPGLEVHTANEGSFRSFIAIDAIFGFRNASNESTIGSMVDGTVLELDHTSDPNMVISEDDRGYIKYGGVISTGADYYVSEKFYVGFEIGFELYQQVNSEVTVDGILFQKSTSSVSGSIKGTNLVRIGMKLF